MRPDEASAAGKGIGEDVLDFAGIGFGPSNLALAVTARETDPGKRGLFFERNAAFQWHSGMVLPDSRVRISFLKDLSTLRDPMSAYTFLNYTKAKGRLEQFINLRTFFPARREYADYLAWVAEAFSDQVRYSATVRKVTPVVSPVGGGSGLFRLEVRDSRTGDISTCLARNVVYAPGGTPRVPARVSLTRQVIHSANFLQEFPGVFPQSSAASEVAVVGSGQSAGEIVAYIMRHYPEMRVHLILSGYGPRPADDSPFTNEVFFEAEARAFHCSPEDGREAILASLRDVNYGVMDVELIEEIYRLVYADAVRGSRRLSVQRFSSLASAQPQGDRLLVRVDDRISGATRELSCDSLVLATGYERNLDAAIFSDVLPFIEKDSEDQFVVNGDHSLRSTGNLDGRIYVQGIYESSHGPSEPLLSLLPLRSRDIFASICGVAADASKRAAAEIAGPTSSAAYPPKRHLECDREKIFSVIERYPFATLVCTQADGRPLVTQLPLILDRSRGAKGRLFGHIDRSNPQADYLDGCRMLALFNGPNAYISPHTYESDQLPTWNSITVHAWGKIRVLSDREDLLRGLASICEHADRREGAYRLNLQDPRIDRLLGFIVGFELDIEELIGRFKLSQDRAEPDSRRAVAELANRDQDERAFIEEILGF